MNEKLKVMLSANWRISTPQDIQAMQVCDLHSGNAYGRPCMGATLHEGS